MNEVLVVGAGVSGLTTAVRLLEAGLTVEVRTRDLPEETTSAVAAAVWYPYEAQPAERVAAWALRSLVGFSELARDPGTGVTLCELLDLGGGTPPLWARDAPGFRVLEQDELVPGYEGGWRARVPVVEMPLYLDHLRRRLEALGGALCVAPVASLAEAARGFRAVVNCAGLGARELASDREVFPIRGQIARVSRGASPTTERVLVFTDADGRQGYVIPRSRDRVLGGTAEHGESSLAPDAAETERILARCRRVEPGLAQAELLEVVVGLRPGRSAVRLEADALPDGTPLVHDYGHGGAGVTLSLACSEDAARLVLEALEAPR